MLKRPSLNTLTIQQVADRFHQKEFSATELAKSCLEAIRANDSAVHAYLEVFEDAVLKQAKHADEMLKENSSIGPLFGIPAAIKDNILIKGRRCTAGSKILQNYLASYDATVINKLKNAGAIFLGKTNLDEFAMGSSTENSAYGVTKNPRDISRVPGGSSGGSAAAVAADECIFALGSDTGGSIRQPAALCGIVGLKPTYGSVSRHGLIALASSLDQVGPLTKTVEDAALVFDILKGKDRYDSTTSDEVFKSNTASRPLKFGVPREYFGSGLDPRISALVKGAISKLEKLGYEMREVSLPHSDYALPAYYIILPAEASANLARFDGIRYGASVARYDATLYDVYAKTRQDGFGPEVKRRIMLGTYALSAGYYDAYYLKAQKVRRLIRDDFERAFEKVDFLVGPTTPHIAFKFGEKVNDPLAMYLEDIYTVAINLVGVPALSLPCGVIEEEGKKLPVGLQIIGRWFDERTILRAGALLEKEIKFI